MTANERASISHRTAISYIDRTRDYYAALGYEKPYRWPHCADVPFAPLARPLAECSVGLVTTASLTGENEPPAGVLRGDKTVWSGCTDEPPKQLYTKHLSWDKETTHTDDVDSFLPVNPLKRLQAAGRIGRVAPRFYGVPTDYSQRRTREEDAPEIARRCREDGVDALLLVPL